MPPTPGLSPQIAQKTGDVGGEKKTIEMLTQGGARATAPRLPWALFYRPSRAL
jgi:hypothetical protein